MFSQLAISEPRLLALLVCSLVRGGRVGVGVLVRGVTPLSVRSQPCSQRPSGGVHSSRVAEPRSAAQIKAKSLLRCRFAGYR